MKKNKVIITGLVLSLIVFLTTACYDDLLNRGQTESSEENNIRVTTAQGQDYLLGTFIQMKVRAVNPEEKIEQAMELIDEIEADMSLNLEDSEINKINNAAGKEAVAVSEATFEVVSSAVEYAQLSDGRFDPTVGPLVELWDISSGGREVEAGESQVPSASEINEKLELIAYDMVDLDSSTNEIYLQQEGMKLDIGGIAKGYAADVVIDYLTESQAQGGYISLGGSVAVFGEKEGDSAWQVGIQDPLSTRGSVVASVELSDLAVDTSGNYERYFMEDGVRYHHIVSTDNGYPVDAGVISATILSESSMEADALSTIVFTSGVDRGLDLIAEIDGVETMIITDEQEVYLSDGIEEEIEILNDDYQIIF